MSIEFLIIYILEGLFGKCLAQTRYCTDSVVLLTIHVYTLAVVLIFFV